RRHELELAGPHRLVSVDAREVAALVDLRVFERTVRDRAVQHDEPGRADIPVHLGCERDVSDRDPLGSRQLGGVAGGPGAGWADLHLELAELAGALSGTLAVTRCVALLLVRDHDRRAGRGR